MKVKELMARLQVCDPEQFVLIQDRENWVYDIGGTSIEYVAEGLVVDPDQNPNALSVLVISPC